MLLNVTTKWMTDLTDYWIDTAQRTVLFTDVLRKRGNVYLDHLKEGQLPVLAFDYEMVVDGRRFERPVNYALVRILDRRQERAPEQGWPAADRRHRPQIATGAPEATRRPIVIFDPRAGHGPGIGGSKQDSQIGMALDAGHPVYFLIFFTHPEPGQTLLDVRDAQIQFLDHVRKRHPGAPKPAVIGNCQGGWAAALVGAERPDLVGPMVLNGSPLSYWGGVKGAHPMRYLGGMLGGAWVNSLVSDLGNGLFDGAHLVANFEALNPANTLWAKPYHLYANIDSEEQRFLDFEKWWGGFFLMTGQEIHQIVRDLFIGNKLERGELELEPGRRVDLRHNDNPIVVFSSAGDNITPPQQALNWIVKTYGTVDDIKRRGQVIVYIGHARIGHLGIFVSAKIARKEHREIIASFDMLHYLPPGLYEMTIAEERDQPGEYAVGYTEKTMADILALDDGLEDEKAFLAVRQVSETADRCYRHFVSPWVRSASSPATAQTLRQLHPLRMQRYMFSDLNPWMLPVKQAAAVIKKGGGRRPAAPDNPFRAWETLVSGMIVDSLNYYRDTRDAAWEALFQAFYENPWMKLMANFAGAVVPPEDPRRDALCRQDADRWRRHMATGEFPDAVVRIFLAMGIAGQKVCRRSYDAVGRLLARCSRMVDLAPEDLRQIVREQSRIVQTDVDQAIATLPRLLPAAADRRDALALLDQAVAVIGRELAVQERAVLEKVKALLDPLTGRNGNRDTAPAPLSGGGISVG